MATQPAQIDWKTRLKAELRRDKKKATLMTVLLAVGMLLVVRMVVKVSGSPKQAAGAQGTTAVAVAPDLPADPARIGLGPSRLDNWVSHRPANGTILRDLFEPRLNYYAKVTADPEPTTQPAAVDQAAIRAEEQAKAIRAQAAALSLQSTMVGANPSAVINGQVLRVGDWVDGFSVIQIAADTCTVEREGVRVRLEMKN